MTDLSLFPYLSLMEEGWQSLYRDERSRRAIDNLPKKSSMPYIYLFDAENSNIPTLLGDTYSIGIGYYNEEYLENLDREFTFRHLNKGGCMGKILMYKECPPALEALVKMALNGTTCTSKSLIEGIIKVLGPFPKPLDEPQAMDTSKFRKEKKFRARLIDIPYQCSYMEHLANCLVAIPHEEPFVSFPDTVLKTLFELDMEKGIKRGGMLEDIPAKSKRVYAQCVRITSNTGLYDEVYIDYDCCGWGSKKIFQYEDFIKHFRPSFWDYNFRAQKTGDSYEYVLMDTINRNITTKSQALKKGLSLEEIIEVIRSLEIPEEKQFQLFKNLMDKEDTNWLYED